MFPPSNIFNIQGRGVSFGADDVYLDSTHYGASFDFLQTMAKLACRNARDAQTCTEKSATPRHCQAYYKYRPNERIKGQSPTQAHRMLSNSSVR
ncbi:hypothetical protein BIFANG_02284 [Bifidobacterium angulatum DSM 20098 = JCM 7096]|uniref:Uncharacterized protein n=1 Tax=Bifidobacterium angulatum DSM 20098 = JCM 7096 TaxID=518635 RepID=C4FDA0_9BIFI|nr:hypothetical protein BIFANG_02284 [Bifidobacterium angulatum DSM 20098 = JCM 7096]